MSNPYKGMPKYSAGYVLYSLIEHENFPLAHIEKLFVTFNQIILNGLVIATYVYKEGVEKPIIQWLKRK